MAGTLARDFVHEQPGHRKASFSFLEDHRGYVRDLYKMVGAKVAPRCPILEALDLSVLEAGRLVLHGVPEALEVCSAVVHVLPASVALNHRTRSGLACSHSYISCRF
jgi:hypothetical protein